MCPWCSQEHEGLAMPSYYGIKRWKDDTQKKRVIERLIALRKQLKTDVVSKCGHDSFRLATWNIRDFDTNKWGHGFRLPESYYYIAEIISAFDLVAVQEIQRNMKSLKKLVRLLGPDWDYIVSDTTEGSGGNLERLAFLFNKDRIQFKRMVGEVVLPKTQRITSIKKIPDPNDPDEEIEVIDGLQFARTPYLASFQAGWFKFVLCTVHIYFGASSGKKLERRIKEIRRLAKFFTRRQKKEKQDYILLGDFNIVDDTHETMKALSKEGFEIAENLTKEKSNLKGDKHYDQIAMKVKNKQLEIGASGVFHPEKSVFRNADYDAYFDSMPPKLRDFNAKGEPHNEDQKRAYYRNKWRTWQISDHLPMWVEFKVDFTDDYLKSLKPE